jgi:hypothetical protein
MKEKETARKLATEHLHILQQIISILSLNILGSAVLTSVSRPVLRQARTRPCLAQSWLSPSFRSVAAILSACTGQRAPGRRQASTAAIVLPALRGRRHRGLADARHSQLGRPAGCLPAGPLPQLAGWRRSTWPARGKKRSLRSLIRSEKKSSLSRSRFCLICPTFNV